MKIHSAGLSRVGERERNEDRYAIARDDSLEAFILADGSGGHGAGDQAAERAVAAVAAGLPRQAAATPQAVRNLLTLAHEAVLEGQRTVSTGRDMHATLVVVLVDTIRGLASWGHVGDSRIYHLRGGVMLSRTLDHSVVQSLQDAGFITPEQARDHPNRSQLLSALGTEEPPELTVGGPLPVGTGDAFLLCSDGWWESLDDAMIAASLRTTLTPEVWLADMEGRLLSRPRRYRDNYTAIGLVLEGDAETTVIRP